MSDMPLPGSDLWIAQFLQEYGSLAEIHAFSSRFSRTDMVEVVKEYRHASQAKMTHPL
jgi:hypothetical protein